MQRLTCYHARVVEATARRSDQPHAAHEAPDLANQVADRPPVLLDLGRYHAGCSHRADPASVSMRGGTPWAPPPRPRPP